MLKRYLALLSVSAMYFVQAQDVSVIRNSVDVYTNPVFQGSSKYNAMVGSMGALGADVSVMNTNPAGIGVAIASDVSATLSINKSKNTTTLGSTAMNFDLNNSELANIGGIAVFEIENGNAWKFLNIGINYSTASIEDYSEAVGNSNIRFDLSSTDYLQYGKHAYNRYGDISKMNFGSGANYDNRIYIGAGINLHSAQLEQYDTAGMNQFDTNGMQTASSVYNKQYTPYLEDAAGFSASVGVIGKVDNHWRLGLALETPTWWRIERQYTYYSSTDATYSEDRSLATPMKATLSAAYVANKNFAINVDYTLGLTKSKFGKMSADAQTEINNFISDNAKSLSEVKVGAEYRVKQFRLRVGYGYASQPFNDMTISVYDASGNAVNTTFANLYAGSRSTLGLGLGYDFRAFALDLAYQNISTEYQSPFLKGSQTAGTGYFSDKAYFYGNASAVSTVKNIRNNFTVTLGWKF